MALSKVDLLADHDVFWFRDLLLKKVGDDLEELRGVLGGLVEAKGALSVGEDFLLVSSASFGEDKIDVTRRVGVDLVLPVAAILPFERLVMWADAKKIPPKLADKLLNGVHDLAPLILGGLARLPKPWGPILTFLGSAVLSQEVLNSAAALVGDELEKVNSEATDRQDNLVATLTRFKMDLDRGEELDILLRSLG